MTTQLQIKRMTPEEYLAWEEQQPMKYEYVNGEVYRMTRETLSHNDIALNLASALKSNLQGKSCKVQTADTKVGAATNDHFFYPDVVVSCDRRDRESRDIFYYPCLIVEVLSSSTEAFDRSKKFEHYRQIETLKEYILIDSEKICIECYQFNEKNKWELTIYPLHKIAYSQQEFSVKLESINFELTSSLLYENVVFSKKINIKKDTIENLEQQDFSSDQDIESSDTETPEQETRLIRRFADWWETTPIEKFIEDIDYFLANLAVFNVVALLANITLILSLVGWFTGREERKEEKFFATWSIINGGQGDKSGVVKKAVERLHKNKFTLDGLTLNKTYLGGAELSQANLVDTELSEANLINTNLSEAILISANLSKADLRLANLSNAILDEAKLSQANLSQANLDGANLFDAKFTNAQIKLACNWKGAVYVKSKMVEEITELYVDYEWVPEDKQANEERIKEIEQDKDSDPQNPPNCSIWE
ncbi:MAG: Uma2 family endonuclease [Cyanobacteria bacterium P01_H01_bin.35]